VYQVVFEMVFWLVTLLMILVWTSWPGAFLLVTALVILV
jgi:hypothetical protein